jgi:hypothetical protein
LGNLIHTAADKSEEIPSDLLSGFLSLAFSDTDIMGSMMSGKPLSDASANKVKNFFLDSDSFATFVISSMEKQDPQTSKCFGSLTKEQKKRVINIVLKQIDFKTIFTSTGKEGGSPAGLGEPTDAQTQQITKEILSDKELGPKISKCIKV